MQDAARRAKIICTIGPKSDSPEMIELLIAAGMDVARLNFSHGTHAEHKARIGRIRQAAAKTGHPVAILQDLQGPKIRVGKFPNGPVMLETGKPFVLSARDIPGSADMVSVTNKHLHQDVKPGDTILLDDGLLQLEVEKIDGSDVHCRVIVGGELSDSKGLNLPGSTLSIAALTEKDRRDLDFGLENNLDYIALSFVQRPEDIAEIKQLISDAGKDIPVVAKIEKPQAVERIEDIINLTDTIMIARGDLGVEMKAEEVPPVQKQIIRLCNQTGTPVITATQMLDSMINNPRPTRAEASDVANAVLDGSDALMLSGETASGAYPEESVRTMARIIQLIENQYERRRNEVDRSQKFSPDAAIGYSACQAAELVNARVIVCLTQSGHTAGMIARFRPARPILAITPLQQTVNRVALLWGVRGIAVRRFRDNFDETVEETKRFLREMGIVEPGDSLVITAGLPFYLQRNTNMLRIEEIK
jgi:pyruvate kinase